MSPHSVKGKVLLADRFLAGIEIFAMVVALDGHLSSGYLKVPAARSQVAAGTPGSSGSFCFLTESHVALVLLESSRQFEMFEDTRVLLVVPPWRNHRLKAVGDTTSLESGVDASTLPCHQQVPVPLSSSGGDLGCASLVGQSCAVWSP